jgi:hypothetical protein
MLVVRAPDVRRELQMACWLADGRHPSCRGRGRLREDTAGERQCSTGHGAAITRNESASI